MAVPKFYEFFGSFLRAVDDGEVHKSNENGYREGFYGFAYEYLG